MYVSGRLGDLSAQELSSPVPVTVLLADLPLGDETGATLRHMRDFVDAGLTDPAMSIIHAASSIVAAAGVPPRDYPGEARALHAFVRDRIAYRKDPDGYELVQDPRVTLQRAAGDCDDKVTLLATLLKAIGHEARFLAVGLNGAPISHVLTQTKLGANWYSAETIINVPFGWHPPGVTSRYILKV